MQSRIAIALLSLLLLSSCGAHVPTAVDLPLMEHQGELRANGVILFDKSKPIYSLSAAYGITDHLAAQAHVTQWNHKHYQGALGWYTTYNNHSVLEVYGGYAYQEAHNQYQSRRYDGDHRCGFLQANYGWPRIALYGKWYLNAGASIKLGYLHSIVSTLKLDDNTTAVPSTYNNIFCEGLLQLGIGYGHFGLNLQGGLNRPIAPTTDIGWLPLLGSIGITFTL